MLDAGLVVFVALVSPYSSDRLSAKALFEPGEFLEVHIDTDEGNACALQPDTPVELLK